MPSKKKNRGNPVVVLRLTPELLARIDAQIARSMSHRFEGGYDRSSFIRACIEERFDKYARAKKAGQKSRTRSAPPEGQADAVPPIGAADGLALDSLEVKNDFHNGTGL